MTRPTTNTVAIASRKGGVTKTTTAVNACAALCALKAPLERERADSDVLLVDLDPQGHATLISGLHGPGAQGAHLVFTEQAPRPLRELAVPSRYGFDVLRGGDDLLLAVAHLARDQMEQYRLRDAIAESDYTTVILDCPGAFGELTIAALIAASQVLVPCTLDALAVDGLMKLDLTVRKLVRNGVNPKLAITAVLETSVDMRSHASRDVHLELVKHVGGLLVRGTIRQSSYFKAANGVATPLLHLMPKSDPAEDYRVAVRELVERGVL